jgi:CheY-like chemotaxis protein
MRSDANAQSGLAHGSAQAEKQALMRDVNARIDELAHDMAGGWSTDLWGLGCECGEADGQTAASLDLAAYTAFRERGEPMLARGHSISRAEQGRRRARETRDEAEALKAQARVQQRRAARARAQLASQSAPDADSADRYSLVVAEDDEAFALALVAMLEDTGRFAVVASVRTGSEAVALVAADPPDAVVIDIRMPLLDGIEATRQIRARNPSLPVVLISGFEYEERAIEAADAGATDYVGKSRIHDDLATLLLSLMRRQ